MQIGVIVKDVGKVENLELLHAERSELRQRGGQHLHGAELQGLHLFLVLVQGAVGIHLDLHLALGQFLRTLGKEIRRLPLRGFLGNDVAELDHNRLLRRNSRGKCQDGHAHQKITQFHRLLQEMLPLCVGRF
ncbi:MAG: hypothetical protein POELPBGB_04069 [Bacteroidia bacterium]|nr:hypothetical protein [Bacteroidia bacterium]